MGTHYLIDRHKNPVANSEINDVHFAESGSSLTNGNFIVRVPSDVRLFADPTDLTDLFNKKYIGLLANYPGFTRITSDELSITGALADAANSNEVAIGDRCTTTIFRTGSVLQSIPVGLTPPNATEAIVTWETYTTTSDQPKNDHGTETYTETPSSNVTVEVSFNNGVSYQSVTDQGIFTILIPDQGAVFIIRFTGQTDLIGLASWAVIY